MNHPTRITASALTATLLATVSPAFAGSLTVQAPVVDVQPVTAPPTEVQRCDDKPDHGRGLAATLAWDMGFNCTMERIESGRITGYRVFYRWDDRVYSRVMAQSPGATIPLSVRVD
ncbi:MAG TPA: hypothetical protein VIS76_15510 [Pseudomonadales bacterium]